MWKSRFPGYRNVLRGDSNEDQSLEKEIQRGQSRVLRSLLKVAQENVSPPNHSAYSRNGNVVGQDKKRRNLCLCPLCDSEVDPQLTSVARKSKEPPSSSITLRKYRGGFQFPLPLLSAVCRVSPSSSRWGNRGKVTCQNDLISYQALDSLGHHSVCRLLTLSSSGPILRTSSPGPPNHDHNHDKWRTHCVPDTVCSLCILFHPNNFIRSAQLCTLHCGWARWS